MSGSRSLGASALTDIRLDKAVIQLALFQAFQHLHTVLQTVYEHLVVAVRILLGDDRLDDASADRIETVDLRIGVTHGLILAGAQIDACFLQPFRQFLEGEDGIDGSFYAFIPDGFLFLRDARSQIQPSHPDRKLPDIAPVGDHGRDHRSHEMRALGVIFLDQIVHAGAAGGDDVRHPVLPHQLLVFVCYQRGAFCGLAHFEESELLQGVHHLSRGVEFQHARIGRGDGDDRFKTLSKIALHPVKIAGECLRVLGTDFQTAPAVDAVIHHDPGLLILDGDGFDRAVAHTFVTVTALRVLKVNDFHFSETSCYIFFVSHNSVYLTFYQSAGGISRGRFAHLQGQRKYLK